MGEHQAGCSPGQAVDCSRVYRYQPHFSRSSTAHALSLRGPSGWGPGHRCTNTTTKPPIPECSKTQQDETRKFARTGILYIHGVSEDNDPKAANQNRPWAPVSNHTEAKASNGEDREGDDRPGPERFINNDGNAEDAEESDDHQGTVAGNQRKDRGGTGKPGESRFFGRHYLFPRSSCTALTPPRHHSQRR